MLDGLHEDLNLVIEKPNYELMDHNGRMDEEISEECWKNHVSRNDSVVVDLMHG